MSKQILLFSDLHLKPETEEVCFQALNGVVSTARNRGVGTIGFLGDFWHLRYNVPVKLLNRVADWVQETCKDLELIMLVGNHDMVHVEGENALQVFDKIDNCKVYTEPTEDSWGAWLPYRKDPKVVSEALDTFSSSILFAHVPIRGAMMNNLMPDENGLPLSMFEKFSCVFSGHYHKRQSHGNVQYIGSPWQTRGDEWGQEKGFALLTKGEFPDLYKVEWINKSYGPKYHRMLASELSSYEGDIAPFDKVRILSDSQDELSKAAQQLADRGLTDVSLEFTGQVLQEQRIKADKQTTLSEYARLFVEDSDTDLDQSRLLREFEELR